MKRSVQLVPVDFCWVEEQCKDIVSVFLEKGDIVPPSSWIDNQEKLAKRLSAFEPDELDHKIELLAYRKNATLPPLREQFYIIERINYALSVLHAMFPQKHSGHMHDVVFSTKGVSNGDALCWALITLWHERPAKDRYLSTAATIVNEYKTAKPVSTWHRGKTSVDKMLDRVRRKRSLCKADLDETDRLIEQLEAKRNLNT